MLPLPSGFEWIVILVIALLILGPGKLPDVASAVGKSIREFRKASTEVQESIKVDTSPLPAGPAQVTQANAPAPQAQTPTPNVLATTAEPNVLTPVAPNAPQPGPDAALTDASPKADG
jgi:sec-independent protein translocase protein TatA